MIHRTGEYMKRINVQVFDELRQDQEDLARYEIIRQESLNEKTRETIIDDWKVLYDESAQLLLNMFPWRICKRKSKYRESYYLLYSKRFNSYVHVLNYSRILVGIQSPVSGDAVRLWDQGVVVEFIEKPVDCILDVRRRNLRVTTRHLLCYQRSGKKKRFSGVIRNKKKFIARLFLPGNSCPLYLGTYETEEEAARARDEFILEHNLHDLIRLNLLRDMDDVEK